jgi:hypothetical protein
LFVVQGDPPHAREAEYHQWYDTVHGPDALNNGSFQEVCRYRAVGLGQAKARFLALWRGDYANEAAAWGYIRPHAEKIRNAGGLNDIASVTFALMMFSADGEGGCPATKGMPILTTVQNDWRHAQRAMSAEAWWDASGLNRFAEELGSRFYTSDPAGKGAGYHLALFEQPDPIGDVIARWKDVGTPGSSPTPPYQLMFNQSENDAKDGSNEPAVANAWTMHWQLISSLP